MLEQLQEIDLRIDLLKNSQKSINEEISGIEDGVSGVREELARLNERILLLEQEKGEREELLATEHENIRRSESHLKEIKTNKEFQAIGREISAAQKQTAELEEQILRMIGQVEELRGESATQSASLAELEQNTAQRSKEKLAEISAIQQDINSDLAYRDEITRHLPANLIRRYNTLREQRRGQAIAIARDGYCLGCNMQLPPQLYNSLFRGDEMISCPHCQRVLILKQQPEG